MYYGHKGKYAEAEPLYRRSLEIKEKVLGPDHPDVAISLNNLAALYEKQGKYVEAEPLHKRSLEIREKALGRDHPDVANSLHNLAVLYEKQGKYAEAEPLYKRSLEISEKALGRDHPHVASSLSNLALLYESQDKYVEAEPLFQRSLEIREKAFGSDHPSVANSLHNLTVLYVSQGKYVEAESLYKRSLEINEKALGRDHPDVASSLSNLAGLYVSQGKYAEAESLNKRSLEIREKAFGSDHPSVATSLNNLALLEAARNRPETAVSHLQRALLIDEHTMDNVFSLASEKGKFAFLRTVASGFDMLQSLVAQKLPSNAEAVRTALDAVLRRKGLVLDALSRERTVLLTSDDPQFAEMARKLHATASRLAFLMLSGPEELKVEAYRNRIDELEAERERLEKELARLSGVYAAKQQSRQVDVEQVTKILQAGNVLVEYVHTRMRDFHASGTEEAWKADHYLAFVLPAGEEANPILVDLGEADSIDQAIHTFRQEVSRSVKTIAREGEAEAERLLAEKGKRVYDLVFAPLEAAVGQHKVVYLAPDGELNLIPFGVLPDEEGRYLGETYRFNYLSSGRDLVRLGPEGPSGSIVVVADPDYNLKRPDQEDKTESPGGNQDRAMPGAEQRSADLRQIRWTGLPGTRREAEAIAGELAGQEVQLYVGDRAVEEVVKGIRSPHILHLATHGFFLEAQDRSEWLEGAGAERGLLLTEFPQRPASPPEKIENPLLRSGLALAGANYLGEGSVEEGVDDGILTALEVSGLPLWGTDLVVLSACETGLGETRRGEGVFGLRRAFQLAGARTVVMSLWSVPDEETASLMTDFYRRMNAGEGKARALQEASLGLMRERREKFGAAHPFYWGAFVSVGEP